MASPFKTEPFRHQMEEFDWHWHEPARVLLWGMRTGKSKATIDVACQLARLGYIDGVLVLAPNGVHENWVSRELPRHHWDDVDRSAMAWSSLLNNDPSRHRREEYRDRLDRFLRGRAPALRWLSVNTEALVVKGARDAIGEFLRRCRSVLLVVDEAHDYRNRGSKRSRLARSLARKVERKRLLTGTPLDNSPLHAWAIFELVKNGALGFRRYEDFERTFAVYGRNEVWVGGRLRQFKVVASYRDLDLLKERMAPWASVVLRSDCVDMPPVLRSQRVVVPSPQQREAYRRLHRDFEVAVDGGEIVTFAHKAARLIKLQQVLSGFVIDQDGEIHDVPGPNPRLDALSEDLAMTPGKAIVWCRFAEDIRRVAERLKADGRRVVEYHGRVGAQARAAARRSFLEDPDGPDTWVGQPQSGGVGLDLSSAATVVWYSHIRDRIVRSQADERASAVGGHAVDLVDFVVPGSVDELCLEDLGQKGALADDLSREGLKQVLERIRI